MKKQNVYIETYGCQMNAYDSELVKSILKKSDFDIVDSEDTADIVMLNTCSVRDNANRKVYNRVHIIKNKRKESPILVGILGCMATNFKTDLLDNRQLKIDFIAGPDSYKQLPHLIHEAQGGQKSYDVTLSEFETYSDIYPTRDDGVNAWIAIMRGCNNFCTFCVVPYTRGRERSRDPQNIVEEVKRLVKEGYKQVTLLGQNVNSYEYEGTDFTTLMKMISDVEGIKRIRFTSPHPKDFPRKLLHLMAERPNICNYIQVPLQSGNDRILEKMNRTYTQKEYLDLIKEMKEIVPNVSLSTDIIVGFPSETETEFQDTYNVVKEVGFETAFIFKYSERPNTRAAAKFPDDVTEEEKKDRITRLNTLQDGIALKKFQSMIGSTVEVLIEKMGTKKSETQFQGRTEGNTIVILEEGQFKAGEVVNVQITGATRNILLGKAL